MGMSGWRRRIPPGEGVAVAATVVDGGVPKAARDGVSVGVARGEEGAGVPAAGVEKAMVGIVGRVGAGWLPEPPQAVAARAMPVISRLNALLFPAPRLTMAATRVPRALRLRAVSLLPGALPDEHAFVGQLPDAVLGKVQVPGQHLEVVLAGLRRGAAHLGR